MPFYEYECQSCKFYTEVLQKITDEPLRKCPSCGKNQLKKLVSAPVFRLKGGGWYETDFKSDKEARRNLAVEKEPESAAASSASESKSTESKPADAKPAESKPAETKPAGSKVSAARPSAASSARVRTRPAAAKGKPAAKSKSRAAPARRKGR